MGWGQAQFGMYRAAWDIVALRAFWDAAARGMLRCGRFFWGGATVQFDMSRPPTAAEETERTRSIPPTMFTRPPALDVASTHSVGRMACLPGDGESRTCYIQHATHICHPTYNAHLSLCPIRSAPATSVRARHACLAAQSVFDALAETYKLGSKQETAELRKPPMRRPRR